MHPDNSNAISTAILDGRSVAKQITLSLKQKITDHTQQGKRPPGLAVILLGNDPASLIYVNAKKKACFDIGMLSFSHHLPAETSEETLLTLLDSLNTNPNIDGILVQLPLPDHINTATIIEHIKPSKDVDGFHPQNLGRLAQGLPSLRPCTPYGVIKLLEHYAIPLAGKHAVVVGASNIVGRPMALELLIAKATVTICHSATRNLEQLIRIADIIVVATGVSRLIDSAWLQSQQVIIDIGMQRLPNGKVQGEIDYNAACGKVAGITPVPGGVGPMTIAMLLHNTWLAAQANLSEP